MIQLQLSKSHHLFFSIGSVLFAIAGVSCFMVNFHSFMYLDFGITMISLFLILLSIFLWFEDINYKQITFTAQEIIIKHQFKTIQYHLDKNTTYNILIRKKGNPPIITIKGKAYHFNIGQSSYPDFFKLKAYIQENYRPNSTLKLAKTIDEQIVAFLFIVLGSALILFVIYSKCFDNKTIPKGLAYIEIEMAEKPRIEKRSKSSDFLKIYSTAHPEFKFRMAGSLTDSDLKIAKIVKKGDVIKIGIQPEVLDAKLLKVRPSTFWERHNRWFHITIDSIEFKGELYKKTTTKLGDTVVIWMLLFLGIGFIWLGLCSDKIKNEITLL